MHLSDLPRALDPPLIPPRRPNGETLDEELLVRIVAAAPASLVELIRSGVVIDGFEAEGQLELTLQQSLGDLRSGESVYLRVEQEDGGVAWSSPIFLE